MGIGILLGIHRVGCTGAPGYIEAAQMTMDDNSAMIIFVAMVMLFFVWCHYRGERRK